jgi:serine protease Do
MNRMSSRQGWFLIVAAALAVSASLGLLLRQDQVAGQDRSATTTIRTPSTSLENQASKTPEELKRDPGVEHAYALSRAFRESAKTAMPSVVTVESHEAAKKMKGTRGENPMGDMFRQFKGTPFEDMIPQMPEGGDFSWQSPPRDGMGTGVIIDKTGIVLTNNHVVDGADKVTVKLADGRTFTATDIKTDPQSDLAVVRIKADSDLPVAHLGNSDELEIGDWVIAIGNPFNQQKTVTAGIISGKDRDLPDMTRPHRAKFLQTDAAINPGNSGGPLVNLAGEVVGINTAIASNSGGYQGIGFAIPMNQAKWVTSQLIKDGSVHRGYLGVKIGDVSQDLASDFGVVKGEGAFVSEVFPNTPAADAKLKEDDVIVKFAGQTVHNSRELPELVEQAPLNTAEPMEVIRDGKPITLHVTVKQMPENYGQSDESHERHIRKTPTASNYDAKDLGVEVADLTADEGDAFKGHEGVLVTKVQPDSVAAEKGLRPGMLVYKIGKTDVHNVKDFEKALAGESLKKGILLHIRTPSNGTGQGSNLPLKLKEE